MKLAILSFSSAFLITYFTIPIIIEIAHALKILDQPDERSSHKVDTPSLGGIAIFSGAVFAMLFWTPTYDFSQMQYVLGGLLLLFLIGARDDLVPLRAWQKLLGQTAVALLLVGKAGLSVTNLHGFLGLSQSLPVWIWMGLSVFVIVFLINAFNLIDGIDGLAGSIGLLILSVFGGWFLLIRQYEWSVLAFSTAGAVLAFLKFNFSPARIFMGDTGSMLLGVTTSILLIQFLQVDLQLSADSPFKIEGPVVVGVGLVFLPLLDTVRVIITRLYRGQSPFKADRRHIHHMLSDAGFTHLEATGLLFALQGLCIALVLSLNRFVDQHLLLALLVIISLSFTWWIRRLRLRRGTRAGRGARLVRIKDSRPQQEEASRVKSVEG